MSDFNSIKTQIQRLITLANQTTGKTDTNLTDCVNSLITGYGTGTEITFSITNTMSNCSTSNTATRISKGATYSATITPKANYQLDSVKVTMSGIDITSSAYSSGKITIADVTGNIVITASAIAITYTITNNLTNCTTSNNVSSITHGSEYKATITASSGYELSSVTITMAGADITSSAYSNGLVVISSVTGNLVITANAIEVVTAPYTNLFDQTADGFASESSTKFYTNWMPYNYLDNGGDGTIYHFKGLTVDTNPYKFQFATSAGTTSALIYVTNANKQARTTASYDSSVKIIQHSVGAPDYTMIRFEIREAVPSDLIITANEDIVAD